MDWLKRTVFDLASQLGRWVNRKVSIMAGRQSGDIIRKDAYKVK